MNLYNDIAVMVKTVSPTLVPPDDLLLYMVYVALVITVSPICLEFVGDTVITSNNYQRGQTYTLKVQDLVAIQLSNITNCMAN
jgi:hypothetical protein